MFNLKKIRTFIFNNIWYDITWQKLGKETVKNSKGRKITKTVYGYTDDPTATCPEMIINPRTSESELLNTLIHESIHATNYKLDERVVTRMADDISSFLWKIGFRLKK